jgi:hypothetical protein
VVLAQAATATILAVQMRMYRAADQQILAQNGRILAELRRMQGALAQAFGAFSTKVSGVTPAGVDRETYWEIYTAVLLDLASVERSDDRPESPPQ